MSARWKVLIIDDEALAREVTRKYLEGSEGYEVIGECANGFEALKAIRELSPDILILDIQMPKIDGFELLEIMEGNPQVIFATAYDQYAIRAFEQNAVDYLLKPFSKERLMQALDRAGMRLARPKDMPKDTSINRLQEHLDKEIKSLERVITRMGNKITVIPVDRIWYIEAQDDYVMIWSELGNHLKEKTMKYFEDHLPAGHFVRVHRSFIVNIAQVRSVELYSKDTYQAALKSGATIRVSQEGYRRLREMI